MSSAPGDCPVCGSDDAKQQLRFREFHIRRCSGCAVLFCDPMPSAEYLDRYYQGFMYSDRQPGTAPTPDQLAVDIRRRCDELRRLFGLDSGGSAHGRFLDFGGGTGAAFAAARQLGFEAFFFDVDERAIAYVKDAVGADEASMVTSLDDVDGDFDYIFCDNVIEHVRDPVQLVAMLYGRLRTGGTLIFKTPNARNTEIYMYPMISLGYAKRAAQYNGVSRGIRSFFDPYWHCDPPRHLYGFSQRGLRVAAEKAGIDERRVSIDYYRLPFWKNTVSSRLLRALGRPGSEAPWKLVVFALLALPELLLKVIQFPLVRLNALSPGGITLILRK